MDGPVLELCHRNREARKQVWPKRSRNQSDDSESCGHDRSGTAMANTRYRLFPPPVS